MKASSLAEHGPNQGSYPSLDDPARHQTHTTKSDDELDDELAEFKGAKGAALALAS